MALHPWSYSTYPPGARIIIRYGTFAVRQLL